MIRRATRADSMPREEVITLSQRRAKDSPVDRDRLAFALKAMRQADPDLFDEVAEEMIGSDT